MTIELQVAEDWSGLNSQNVKFSFRNTAIEIDASNSDDVSTVIKAATTSGNAVGILYDESKLDPSGSVQKNSGVAIRSWGIARALVSAAVTAGDLLKVSDTIGRMAGQATSSNWGNVPIVGRALTSGSGSSSLPLVLLTIGARI